MTISCSEEQLRFVYNWCYSSALHLLYRGHSTSTCKSNSTSNIYRWNFHRGYCYNCPDLPAGAKMKSLICEMLKYLGMEQGKL